MPGPETPASAVNLLRVTPIRALVRSRWFREALQVVTLGGFLCFLVLGWSQGPPEGVPAKLYAKSNLVNLVIWGLWWPAMVWAAVLFGRVWCAICPLELVASCGERAGQRLGIRQRSLGRWLRAGWLVLVLYGVIQMLVSGAGLHRSPAHTSIFLATMLGLALLVGVIYRNRAFCRGFCPVGLLLGTYGRGSMLAVRAGHGHGGEASDDPETRRQIARSCPSLLNPPRLDSSKDCLICGECIRATPDDEMALLLQRPFERANAREPRASWPVAMFVILLSGFVTYELFTNWPAGKAVFLWPPTVVSPLLGLSGSDGWVAGAWKLFVFPLLLWLVLGALMRLAGAARSIGDAWRRLALPAALVVAAGHMAKGLEKIATWGGYLPRALREPLGEDASRSYSTGALSQPSHLLSMPFLSAVSVVLLAVALCFAWREIRLADPQALPAIHHRRGLPLVVLWGAFTCIALRWGLWS